MRLTITLSMDNAAFTDAADNGTEAGRILHELAGKLHGCDLRPNDMFTLRDVNGNKVGTAKVTE